MTKIITINGYKRSGKGETGKAIQSVTSDYLLHAHTLGFADKLKVAACRNLGLLDLSDEECVTYMDYFKEAGHITYGTMPWARSSANTTITGRKYLQWMGTEYRKIFGEDFWVDQVLPKPCQPIAVAADPYRQAQVINASAVEKSYPGADFVVFTDCRFPNEAQRTLDLGGEVWEVVHPQATSDGHASEQQLPRELVTRQIINDGTLDDLRYKVEQALAL